MDICAILGSWPRATFGASGGLAGDRLAGGWLRKGLIESLDDVDRSPSQAIELMSPIQRLSGHEVDYNRLKSFGCATYVHTKEDKLRVRALKCIFLGYPDGVKGYKVWCIEKGKERLI